MADRGDSVELYRPESVVEARAIEDLLEEAGIPCTLVSFESTSYPGIADRGRGWGQVRVRPQDLNQAEALVAEFIDAESAKSNLGSREGDPGENAPASKTRKRWLLEAALVISVGVNALQCSELHAVNTGVDAEGRLTYTTKFDVAGRYPRQVDTIAPDGKVVSRCYDTDTDGRHERCEEVVDGEVVAIYHDRNEDGRFEEIDSVHDGRVTLRLRDTDRNGIYEIAGVPEEDGELGLPLFRDADQDGRFDAVECMNAGRLARFDVAACSCK